MMRVVSIATVRVPSTVDNAAGNDGANEHRPSSISPIPTLMVYAGNYAEGWAITNNNATAIAELKLRWLDGCSTGQWLRIRLPRRAPVGSDHWFAMQWVTPMLQTMP